MSREVPPTKASNFALGIYDINGNDQRRLKAFLSNPAFLQSKTTQLKAEVGGRLFRATKDSFGVCASGAGEYQGDAFLIFRGTTTANKKADFITDARIGIQTSKAGLPVHIGFNHAFNSMLPEIHQFISDAKPSGMIHCIGHSLGGAVASLAADWVSRNTVNKAMLYTFGAPRVGTEWFVKSTTQSIGNLNIHRVYHRTDPVPMVALYPFMQAPYRQLGHYLHSAEPLTSGAAHSMTKYVGSVAGKGWIQLSDAPDQPYNIEAAIESWLKSKTPVDSESPAFWHWVDSALIFVLKKVAMNSLITLQGTFIGAFTLADKIAYILAKGLDLAKNISIWVLHLMQKLMQALRMHVARKKEELTRELIVYVLRRITEKANRDARNALRGL